jgi:diguanylate cyclase (GGDEF)-like protein
VAVTVSVGVATADDGHDTPDALLQAADARLYEAKRTGRNKVVG